MCPLIILGKPPIVIDHEKSIVIKTKFLNGVPMENLTEMYDLSVKVKKTHILVS